MRVLSKWQDIKGRFRQNILLGNGASIAIDQRLSYRSLYERVRSNGVIDDSLIKMFTYFKTTNFEFIMKLLLEASQVNEALNITDKETKQHYHALRNALIETVRGIHPEYKSVEHLLIPIARFLSHFDTVLSLNYDLLVYWSMLKANEKAKIQWFKDCFVGGEFENDFEYLHHALPPATGATVVFYPHGNLFLATDIYGAEVKLSRTTDDYLVNTILDRWEERDFIPLFVSEGNTTEKYQAIARSNYLKTVYQSVLQKITGSLVIYGWSASEQDDHIFNAIDHEGIQKIAVSVHTTNPSWEAYCLSIEERLARTHHLKNVSPLFFDYQCKGCWIYE